jgi:predicted metal-dependent RNase
MTSSRPRIVLVHGEDRAREPFAEKIRERFRIKAELPALETGIQI